MPQPDPYIPINDYSDWQSSNPGEPIPGDFLDVDYSAIAVTLGQTLTNLALIQRDDGELGNETVGFDQLKPELSDFLSGGEGGFSLDGLTDVTISNPSNEQYLQYDSGSGQWVNVSLSPLAPTADQVSYNNTISGLTALNVQDAIDEHVLITSGNPHNVTQADVGLGLVLNAPQLITSLNLSDLADVVVARTNLDVYSKAEVDAAHVLPDQDVTFTQDAGIEQEWKDKGTTAATLALTFTGESNRKVVEISAAIQIAAPTDGVGSMEFVVVQNGTGGYMPTFSGFVNNAPDVQWDTAPNGETWFMVERYRLPNSGAYKSRIQQRRWD